MKTYQVCPRKKQQESHYDNPKVSLKTDLNLNILDENLINIS